jgi:hypothetical protein
MCWACYTPLTEGAAASAVAGPGMGGLGVGGPTVGGPATGPPGQDEEAPAKKAVEPWQMGVIGLFLAIVLFMGVKTLMGGGSAPVDDTGGVVTPPSTGPVSPPVVVPPPPPMTGGAPPAATNPVPAPEATSPFTMVAAPYPNVAWATMAIVPTKTNLSTTAAAALAAFARQQVVGASRWQGFYIYVFADQQSADIFKQNQDKRRGQPLTSQDFTDMKALWPKTLAVYEYSKGQEAVRYPRSNPNSWWQARPQYRKAR